MSVFSGGVGCVLVGGVVITATKEQGLRHFAISLFHLFLTFF